MNASKRAGRRWLRPTLVPMVLLTALTIGGCGSELSAGRLSADDEQGSGSTTDSAGSADDAGTITDAERLPVGTSPDSGLSYDVAPGAPDGMRALPSPPDGMRALPSPPDGMPALPSPPDGMPALPSPPDGMSLPPPPN